MIDRSSGGDSAVSITLGYMLNLGVATLVVYLLVLNANSLLDDVTETATETELEVSAEKVSTKITVADELRRTTDESYGEIPLDLTQVVSDNIGGYEVNVTDADPDETGNITVRHIGSIRDNSVTVPYNVSSEVHGYEWADGERVSVTYNESGVYLR